MIPRPEIQTMSVRRERPRRVPPITDEQHAIVRALFTEIGKISPCASVAEFDALIRPTRQAIYDVTCWAMRPAASEAWRDVDTHVSAIPLEDRQRMQQTTLRVLERLGASHE
jgi:hypothetical protein